jgi:hypothetical protein
MKIDVQIGHRERLRKEGRESILAEVIYTSRTIVQCCVIKDST